MLDVNAINLHYGAAQALRGVSLQAEPGKVTCVLGRNGVGKTSLLRCADRPAAGLAAASIHVGRPGHHQAASRYERARRGIAYVPQGREIFPLLTVEENLEDRLRAAASATSARFPTTCSRCFRCSKTCCAGAAATFPAASSSSWPSAARW